MICPTHKTELINRKGVSKKTGKPYDFWGCTAKDGDQFCGYTENSATVATPERQQLEAKVLAGMNTKLDKLTEMVQFIYDRTQK